MFLVSVSTQQRNYKKHQKKFKVCKRYLALEILYQVLVACWKEIREKRDKKFTLSFSQGIATLCGLITY